MPMRLKPHRGKWRSLGRVVEGGQWSGFAQLQRFEQRNYIEIRRRHPKKNSADSERANYFLPTRSHKRGRRGIETAAKIRPSYVLSLKIPAKQIARSLEPFLLLRSKIWLQERNESLAHTIGRKLASDPLPVASANLLA